MSHNDGDDDDDMADLFSFGAEGGETDPEIVGQEFSVGDAATASSRPRLNSDDSLIDMIENEGVKGVLSGVGLIEDHDPETQDILKWLDNEDDTAATDVLTERTVSQDDEEEQRQEIVLPSVEPTVVALPPIFTSLQEALDSKESTSEQIRQLALTEDVIRREQRPELYCRLVCNKTLEETLSSSLADSFEHWSQEAAPNDDMTLATLEGWTNTQALALSEQYTCNVEDLKKLLLYRLRSHGSEQDLLLPPVAATLLSTGMPLAACSVVLHQILPNYMPLLNLPQKERWEASLSMHSEFYLLAVYHLPLLVFHLDQYLQGWHWPKQHDTDGNGTELEPTEKGRNLQSLGQLPPSWLLSHFAGESNGTFYLGQEDVLEVWDNSFTRQDPALRFFLTLALLEQASDTLILLTGNELKEQFESSLTINKKDGGTSIGRWVDRAEIMRGATPDTVVLKLRTAEDSAVQHTIKLRQERAEQELKLKMEAESIAHKIAHEKKADEARERLNRARLVAFYRKHMPDKENNVDTILVNYAGRLDVLEKKLKAKYGEGFNPAFKSKQEVDVPNETLKRIATLNKGIGGVFGAKGPKEDEVVECCLPSEHVSVQVLASEVLPVFCWSKEAVAVRGVKYKPVQRRKYLKFCIIDCRTEAAAVEQGRFPTSMNLSPEIMMAPEKLNDAEERFESLRGAAHIVIMGDGFSALPQLYNYKLNPRTEELILEDQSRVQNCALFFVKRGFPFVSILEGGFAACHSWIIREGPAHELAASSVLSDYVPDGSLFGQLEAFHNASGAEKAQRRMQSILDKSLTVVAKRAQQLEDFANELDNVETTAAGFRSLFGRGASSAQKSTSGSRPSVSLQESKDGEGLKQFFVGIGKSFDEERTCLPEAEPTSSASEQPTQITETSEPSEDSTKEKVEGFDATAHTPRTDDSLDRKAMGPAPTVNAFANLWRRGTSGGNSGATGTIVAADNAPEMAVVGTTKTEPAGGIGGFLKRNPFARLGSGGASNQTSAESGLAPAGKTKATGTTESVQAEEETSSVLNPMSDGEEEVVFEIGDASVAIESEHMDEIDTTTGVNASKAEVEQV
ncbi:hypothetical protein MPSEU_000210100 [Mayamaea pseudoterrestris]|nr:hypothetical protein MPSEU_000210100 [Mayamaea pseudoterrestris]